MEYAILIIISLLISYRYQGKPKFRKYRLAWFFIGLYCVLLFGFRYRVGVDTLNYMEDYDNFPTLDKLTFDDILNATQAPFYVILSSLCRIITPSFYLIQVIVSLIFNVCLMIFLRRYSLNPFLAFTVFFFMSGLYFNTEILKEALAVGIFLLNIDNLFERRWKSYYLLAFFSLMFHYSAIVIFFFPFFSRLRLNWSFIVCVIVFFLVSKPLSDFLTPLITFSSVADKIDVYKNLINDNRLNTNWIIYALLQAVLIPLIILFISKKGKWKLGKFESLICLCVLLGLGCVYFEIVFQRFTNYVIIVYALCLSNFYASRRVKFIHKAIVALLFITLYSFSYVSNGRYHIWFPYRSILNEEQIIERERYWHDNF